jgi:molybdopterin-synthase adenylyltransferase
MADDRYARQIRFAPLGTAGQARLQEASVAIVGCGALGTMSAAALTRAGMGHIRIIDRDYVELSNLPRQWLFDEQDAAEALPKAIAAQRHLARINSTAKIDARVADVSAATIDELLEDAELVVDATDNFETRFLLNDYCVREGRPWIYGAAVGSYGLAMPVLPGKGPCLRCVYPEPPGGAQPTCDTAGVINSITSMVASWQSGLAQRWLSGDRELPTRLTTFDVWKAETRQLNVTRDKDCPCCVGHEFGWLDQARRAPISLCGRNAVQIHERSRPIALEQLARELAAVAPVRVNEFALRFFPPPYEITIFPDGRAIIKGTQDTGVARSLYSRYVGN